MQTNTSPFIIAMIFTFYIVITGGADGVWQRFSTVHLILKSYVVRPFYLINTTK